LQGKFHRKSLQTPEKVIHYIRMQAQGEPCLPGAPLVCPDITICL